MTSSDSSPGHPRALGTFAQKYAQYVVKGHVISMAQFINSSSALTADTLGLVQGASKPRVVREFSALSTRA